MLKSPYYLIDEQKLTEQYASLDGALKTHWNNYKIAYSYKTNSLPWVIRKMDELGAYAETVSDDEYELAQKIGARGVVYNGVAKSEETFIDAVKKGYDVNLDSPRELEWLEKYANKGVKVGLRVNFDLEKVCPGQTSAGQARSRFGFCCENGELAKAVQRVENSGNAVCGLHMHVSTKTRSVEVYKALSQKACEIADEFDLKLDYVDVGGGFFGDMEGKPSFDEYVSAIASVMKSTFSPDKTALIVEPGISIIGTAVQYVTSVIDVKTVGSTRFVMTDGSRCQIDPLMHKTRPLCRINVASQEKTPCEQVVCGYTCMENDRIMTLSDHAELNVGDQIVYEKAGAYTMCLAPLFIKYYPAVYVLSGNEKKLVRGRFTASQYLSTEEL